MNNKKTVGLFISSQLLRMELEKKLKEYEDLYYFYGVTEGFEIPDDKLDLAIVVDINAGLEEEQNEMVDLYKELNKRIKTILLSTSYLDSVNAVDLKWNLTNIRDPKERDNFIVSQVLGLLEFNNQESDVSLYDIYDLLETGDLCLNYKRGEVLETLIPDTLRELSASRRMDLIVLHDDMLVLLKEAKNGHIDENFVDDIYDYMYDNTECYNIKIGTTNTNNELYEMVTLVRGYKNYWFDVYEENKFVETLLKKDINEEQALMHGMSSSTLRAFKDKYFSFTLLLPRDKEYLRMNVKVCHQDMTTYKVEILDEFIFAIKEVENDESEFHHEYITYDLNGNQFGNRERLSIDDIDSEDLSFGIEWFIKENYIDKHYEFRLKNKEKEMEKENKICAVGNDALEAVNNLIKLNEEKQILDNMDKADFILYAKTEEHIDECVYRIKDIYPHLRLGTIFKAEDREDAKIEIRGME